MDTWNLETLIDIKIDVSWLPWVAIRHYYYFSIPEIQKIVHFLILYAYEPVFSDL